MTFDLTSSFPVEDVFTRVVVPVSTPVVDSAFLLYVTVEEKKSPDDVLSDVNIAVVLENSVRVVPGVSVLEVGITVLDFRFDVTCDVTVDVSMFVVDRKENVFVTAETVVEAVGVSVVKGCEGTMVTPGLKHCTLIEEFSVKCRQEGQCVCCLEKDRYFFPIHTYKIC